jgi:prevent-host-death family protein
MRESMRSTVSAKEARLRFGAMVKRVRAGETPLVVERNGQPMLVVLSPANYEQLLNDARLAHFDKLARAAGLDAEQVGLTEEQLEREMELIRLHEHQETYG